MSEQTPIEQATEQGYIGTVADDLPNEAYTVSADHAATAAAERAAVKAQRDRWEADSREPEPEAKSTSKSSKSSGSGSSGGSS